jgi:hypothetical protein
MLMVYYVRKHHSALLVPSTSTNATAASDPASATTTTTAATTTKTNTAASAAATTARLPMTTAALPKGTHLIEDRVGGAGGKNDCEQCREALWARERVVDLNNTVAMQRKSKQADQCTTQCALGCAQC